MYKELRLPLTTTKNDNFLIGILGGSFNPPHEGHLNLSIEARKKLSLDKVIWLITPQNPRKNLTLYEDIERRLLKAREITKSFNFIETSLLENHLRTSYSYQTVHHLNKVHSNIKLVWLMGADNIAHINQWYKWQYFLQSIEIAVFDREPYSYGYCKSRVEGRSKFFKITRNNMSSSLIRKM